MNLPVNLHIYQFLVTLEKNIENEKYIHFTWGLF
ncbi:hypothetical protein MCERE19_01412 [Spirosomataceae bacterium]|jgi:hypothetical protein